MGDDTVREESLYGEILGAGAQVGPFVVDQAVAQAGFSSVYRASDPATGRVVAIKILHGHLAESPRAVERFRREAEALERVRHPHIVAILEYGELYDGRPFIAMEWLEGMSLRDFVRSSPFSLEEALPLLRQLCDALSAAHGAGVLHRDLKSNNVMVLPVVGGASTVKLVDFGIAQPTNADEARRTSLTTTGRAVGTPHAMAPEQIYGQDLDERTDVYALGVLLFEMLTGKKPFRAQATADIIDMHLSSPPPKASELAPLPPAVDGVIQRCMAKKREDRFDSIADALAAIERAVAAARAGEASAPLRDGTQEAEGVGVYFEVQIEGDEDDLEDEDFDVIEGLLVLACEECERAGMRIALSSGTSVLAVALIPPSGPRRDDLRERALAAARAIAAKLPAASADRVKGALRVHSAPVVAGFARGATDFVGGALLELGTWAADCEPGEVLVTGETLRGLEDRFASEPVTARESLRRLAVG